MQGPDEDQCTEALAKEAAVTRQLESSIASDEVLLHAIILCLIIVHKGWLGTSRIHQPLSALAKVHGVCQMHRPPSVQASRPHPAYSWDNSLVNPQGVFRLA